MTLVTSLTVTVIDEAACTARSICKPVEVMVSATRQVVMVLPSGRVTIRSLEPGYGVRRR